MNIQSILLGLLMQKSMSGYELKKVFSISFSYFSGLSFGSIYPALKKMAQHGLITMRLEIQENAPNKKVYSITEAGKDQFHALLKQPVQADRFRSEFLSRLFFFSHLEKGERVALVSTYLESIREEQQHLEAARPEVKTLADPFQRECLLFGIRMKAAMAENVEKTLKALKKI
jgi:DNA-binding PadR family transcriptional regulator